MGGGDDERPRLARDVDERRLPGVAVVGGRGDVDLDARLVEREARERHVVLPADQPADPAERRRDRAQAVAVALAPDEALVVRRHELAVLARERAVGGVVEQRVVERRGPRGVDLGDAGDDPDAVLPRGGADPRLGLARDGDRLAGEQRERLGCARLGPARERLRPDRGRVRGDERLREDEQLRAARRPPRRRARASLSIVASRSSTTGSAWMQATLTAASMARAYDARRSPARSSGRSRERRRALLGDLDGAGADDDAVGERGHRGRVGRASRCRSRRRAGRPSRARARSTRPASAGETSARAPVVPVSETR